MIIRRILFLTTAAIVSSAFAQQSTPYLLLQFPKMAMPASMPDTVGWTGVARPLFPAPDSGVIYFDRSPGGSILSNYRYKIEKFCVAAVVSGKDTSRIVQNNIYLPGKVPQRRIIFKPSEQTNMGYGLFYYVVGFKTSFMGRDTTFVSNEMELIVESPVPAKPKAPLDTITELTPVFQWEPNPSVPYYHVILSDEALNIDTTKGLSITGISVSWQAITPFTQITYGSPDPSGTLTSSPPPLSPGKTYYWAVLNNYKNNMLYTSSRVGLPVSFTVKGQPLVKTKNITPKNVTLTSSSDSVVTFKWTNLDPRANTYKLYLYIASGLKEVDAKMVAWSSEVTAGTFAGANGRIDTTDTGFITINARSVLSKNHYTWKVFAIDAKGASTSGDTSSFEYTDPATGRLVFTTREKIISATATGGLDTALSVVAAVALQVEVLRGTQEAPLLFYTDLSGSLDRERPAGTYRITAQKSGFEPLIRTVTLDSGATIRETFYLKRPDATVFGKVVDKTNSGINVATVVAVSDRGDTVTTQTDVLGSFIVNCYEGSWRISARKTGYSNSLPKQAEVTFGQSYSLGSIALDLNSFALSATVVNEKGEPITGADVKIYSGAAVVDELPSTPQSGTASFSLNAGTYTVSAAKIGFEQYSKTVDLSSSMQLTILMPSGAAMIKGAVIGAAWIGNARVYAPITRAGVVFSDTTETPAKTFSTATDATYGDYGISVSGGRRFTTTVTASGFVAKTGMLPEATVAGTTMLFYDTLKSLGMLSGTVTMSGSGSAVGGATVTLLTPLASRVAASATSQGSGYFEIRNLPDGVYYVKAGAPGFSLDSVRASDTLYVSDGKTSAGGSGGPASLAIRMSPGSKAVSWVINGGSDTSAIVSVQSPLQKVIRPGQVLGGVGWGDYIVSVNGRADSILDCSYHPFTILASESLHVDSVELPVVSVTADSLSIVNDSVTLAIASAAALDSAAVFYRDIAGQDFSSVSLHGSQSSYAFSIRPPKDGSILNYYFIAFRGKDRYGSAGETFFSFIRPDTTRLSKIELIPSAGDTVFAGAQSELRIAFQGYFGSAFIPAHIRDTSAILWRLGNAPKGTRFLDSTGVEVAFVTGDEASSGPVALTAIIDTSRQKVTPQVLAAGNTTMYFLLTGKKVASIRVRRIDAGTQTSITTSPLATAQFFAEGRDAEDNVSMVSPQWSVSPPRAGAISTLGVFKPSSRFAGMVRIFAKVGGLTGEYNAGGKSENAYGLEVKHCVVARSQFDTASNMRGCALYLPDSIVAEDKPGLLLISMPDLKNRLEVTTGALSVVGPVYDITEEQGALLRIGGADSIRIVLDIPEASVKQGADKARGLRIGTWDEDSLRWNILPGSAVDFGNRTVSASIGHFSRYALLTRSTELVSTLSILPNPFSPDRRASEFQSLALRLGYNTPKGTCISFTPESPDATIQQVRVAIYTIAGEQVAGVVIENALKLVEYRLWWDGRSTGRERVEWPRLEVADKNQNERKMSGKAMCRNGRYFVVLTLRDNSGKEKNYMKQVVLIK